MRAFQGSQVPYPKGLSAPAEWSDVDVEIGAGQGLHSIRYCSTQPQRHLLAIERTTNKFLSLKGRAQRHPALKNLHPLHADAVAVITHLLPKASIGTAFLLYPNPYPKPKQANKRWHNSPFMSELIAKLKADGRLVLATNLLWYADEAEKTLTEAWGLNLLAREVITDPAMARTHFEKKYLEAGQACYSLVFAK